MRDVGTAYEGSGKALFPRRDRDMWECKNSWIKFLIK